MLAEEDDPLATFKDLRHRLLEDKLRELAQVRTAYKSAESSSIRIPEITSRWFYLGGHLRYAIDADVPEVELFGRMAHSPRELFQLLARLNNVIRWAVRRTEGFRRAAVHNLTQDPHWERMQGAALTLGPKRGNGGPPPPVEDIRGMAEQLQSVPLDRYGHIQKIRLIKSYREAVGELGYDRSLVRAKEAIESWLARGGGS